MAVFSSDYRIYTTDFPRQIEAIVKNVGLEDVNINIRSDKGPWVGAIFGDIFVSKIDNCYSTGNISVYSKDKYVYAGGIAGHTQNSDSVISNCYNASSISAVSESSIGYTRACAGGIVGDNVSTKNCYNEGDVTATILVVSGTSQYSSSAIAGGICGNIFYDDLFINNCYNTGAITSNSSDYSTNRVGSYAGGICGSDSGATLISDCYNMGSVSASSMAPISDSYAGGITGESYGWSNENRIVNKCYNTGSASTYCTSKTIMSLNLVAGISGMSGATYSNDYWNIDSIQKYNGIELEKNEKAGFTNNDTTGLLTTVQMKDVSNFVGFDFDAVWAISPEMNNGYPYLRAFSASEPQIKVALNGRQIVFDQPPIIQDGRTLVPLRAIFEAMGASVEWDSGTQTVTAVKDEVTVSLTIGSNVLINNGENIALDVPAQLIGGRTLVPARTVAESFGAKVDWDGNTQTVIITDIVP